MKLNKKGFTLVELLGAIVILGVLMGTSVMAVTRYLVKTRKQDYKSMEESAYSAAQNYMLDYGVFAEGSKLTLDINNDLVAGEYLKPLVDPVSKDYAVCGGTVEITNEAKTAAEQADTELLDNLKYTVKINCKKYSGTETFPKS